MNKIPSSCDYLVIGGGATGMAFCDTLLKYCHASSNADVAVVMMDSHEQPGGQWHDSYAFVQLHQPSRGYGVESEVLEPSMEEDCSHLATRQEILDYYQRVRQNLEAKYNFVFCGGVTVDLAQLDMSADTTTSPVGRSSEGMVFNIHQSDKNQSIVVRKRVVDARYLQPDLPISVPPKFSYNPNTIRCIPVNDVTSASPFATCKKQYFVVLGAGKTGMDAIVYLLQTLNIPADHILWVRPNDAWITAREQIGNCMEFLHTCCSIVQEATNNHPGQLPEVLLTSPGFFQQGFLKWEQEGKVYRLDPDVIPTKFKDATLSKNELELLQSVTRVISHQGRVEAIADNGDLHLDSNTTVQLPWPVEYTSFVHCTAGAFNYSQHLSTTPPSMFAPGVLTIQDVYGTPGFCFVGSLLGRLESIPGLTDDEKNCMCQAPTPDPAQASLPLGPSGGDLGVLSPSHGYVQRLCNLRQWLQIPQLKEWLVGHRLFHLGHKSADEIQILVDETWHVLLQAKMVF